MPRKEESPESITYVQPFAQFMRWNNADDDYILKEIHNKNIMSQEDENKALTEMLQLYVDLKTAQQQKIKWIH